MACSERANPETHQTYQEWTSEWSESCFLFHSKQKTYK
jgi:hypothetical protein